MNKFELENTSEEPVMPLLSLMFYRTCSLAIKQQEKAETIPDYQKRKEEREAPCTLQK